MSTHLTLDLVKSQLSKTQRLLVSEETIEEINKLAEDPEYGEEFLSSYLDHLNILKENIGRNHRQYLEAVKFFSLVESGNSLTDAYIKTFPQRYTDRTRNQEEPSKDVMRSEASRYNGTLLVNEIRKVATIPIQLIHRHLLHDAILVTAQLMIDSKSDMVKQKAADTLIRELKPSEDQVLNIVVDDGSASVIEELHKATKELAAQQFKNIQAGVSLKEIATSKITEIDDSVVASD